MKELLILSGKGGTGKTTIASAFIRLLSARAYADCDVDAPNLHLIYGDKHLDEEREYYAMPSAVVDTEKCVGCMACAEYCREDAITMRNGVAHVDMASCEGCGVCQLICPQNAISMERFSAGKVRLYRDRDSIFTTAELEMGRGTSGKLVTEVKSLMRQNKGEADIAIIDGSPGIGCPVIASLSGVSMVLIVAEPSISGISDMRRIVDTARGFGVEVALCVNKYDINIEKTAEIEAYAREQGIHFVGKIPYDEMAVVAINEGKSIVDMDSKSARAVREIYANTMQYL